MKIVLYAVGSRGDFQPILALGHGLKQAGFEVRLATHRLFQLAVEKYGLEYTELTLEPLQIANLFMEYVSKAKGNIVKVWLSAVRDYERLVVKLGRFVPIDSPKLLFATVLTMVGAVNLFGGFLLYFLFRKNGWQKRQRNYWMIGVVGTLIIALFPQMQGLLRPVFYALAENFNPILSPVLVFLSWLVAPMDCKFPYLGFYLYGVLVGMLLLDEIAQKHVLALLLIAGMLIAGIGIFLIRDTGFYLNIYDTPGMGPLLGILGPMLIVIAVFLRIMDFSKSERREQWLKRSVWLRRFGILALTVFILEGTVVQLLSRIFSLIKPDWGGNGLIRLFIFCHFVLILWGLLLKLWSRVNFKYSLEYFIVEWMQRLSGCRSIRLNAESTLHSTAAYLEQNQPDS
jgi:hypothetical protein